MTTLGLDREQQESMSLLKRVFRAGFAFLCKGVIVLKITSKQDPM